MLIYNFQKEFLGIDEDDLKALGFANLQELRAESADFADMFVKTPGHVHNFTNVHWIDFVTCSDYNEDSKVIIHANNKNYKCTLNIKTAYLVDNPSQKAFLVNLSNLIELSTREDEQISKDIYDKPIPVSTTASNPIFNTPEFETEYGTNDIYEDVVSDKPVVIDEYDKYEAPPSLTTEAPALNVIKDDFIQEPRIEEQKLQEEIPLELDISTTDDDDNYEYDPMVASQALGLPVDLIEEFLQDFIIQSQDFKIELYDSVERSDLSNVKILSHKLKGVAANLRVEDAFDALTVINSSDDTHEIKASLTSFYKIISHLAGDAPENTTPKVAQDIPKNSQEEVITPVKNTPVVPIIEEEEFVISFKDDDEIESIEIHEDVLKVQEDIEPLEFQEEFQEMEPNYIDDIDDPQEVQEIKEEILGIVFDKNLAAGEIGLDLESYDELLKDYVQENLMTVESINKAIEEGDFQMWKKHAQKLKGMSDNMRIDVFMQELEELSNTQEVIVAKKAIHDIATKVKQISVVEV